MARICPNHIEATTFALLASTSNFRHYTRSTIGSYINENYVGVTEKDLSNYYILVTISTVCSLLPLLLIKLIPTRAQIEKLQTEMGEDDAEKTNQVDSEAKKTE